VSFLKHLYILGVRQTCHIELHFLLSVVRLSDIQVW
jgi:hypothetical protein